jgi:KDO2-lipid IV(A) lauroyltransferase
MPARIGTHLLIGLLWLLHFLPLSVLAALGRGLGALLWRLAGSRRRVALRNLELCFPEKSAQQREALAREHFGWLARSLLDRSLMWFAPAKRLQRIMHIKGDIGLAERAGPVTWILPHFVGLEWAALALGLNQRAPGVCIYQRQSNPVFDARLRAARSRFGTTHLVNRHEGVRSVLRHIRNGYSFVNSPDQDFGPKDSAFVPFFGVPACTLLAPAKIATAMKTPVQPVVVTMLPDGQGYQIELCEPPPGYPSGDLVADARALNDWLETKVREQPAQYFWVHKRFKTRPEGEASLY